MLSLSGKDHNTKRAFISDKCWVKKKAAEAIKCSPRSISNNLITLENVGLIIRDEVRKAYIFPEYRYEALISHKTIKLFLSLDGQIDSVEALRIYSIIQHAAFHGVNQFCATDIKYALGKPNLNAEYIRLCLGWWQSIGLIEYTEQKVNKGYCSYVLYTVTKINQEVAIADDDGPLSEEFKQLFSANSII